MRWYLVTGADVAVLKDVLSDQRLAPLPFALAPLAPDVRSALLFGADLTARVMGVAGQAEAQRHHDFLAKWAEATLGSAPRPSSGGIRHGGRSTWRQAIERQLAFRSVASS
jgi:hypothetical protein